MMRRWFAVGALCAVLLLGAILAARTASVGFSPGAPPVALAPAVPFDDGRAARRLAEALRFPTISHEDPAADDAGAFAAQRAWLKTAYPALGAKATLEATPSGALLYTWRGARPDLPPMVLMAHQDVAPVDGGWTRPPFSGAIAQGAVWGRGALDAKGPLIAALEALETLAASGFRPLRTVMLVADAQGETTGAGAAEVAERLRRRDVHALFVLDGGPHILEKAPVTGRPLALVGVVEAGRAVLRVAALGGVGAKAPETARGVLARATAAICGKAPPLAVRPPLDTLLDVLAAEAPLTSRVALANLWLFQPLVVARFAATPGGAALLHTTLEPEGPRSGSAADGAPRRAVARILVRILPGDRSAAVLERARKAVSGLAVAVGYEGRPTEPTQPSSSRSGAFRVIAALVREAEGAPTAPTIDLSPSDSRNMTPAATDIFTFTPVRLTAEDAAGVRGRDEHITLANLHRLEAFYARLVATVGGG